MRLLSALVLCVWASCASGPPPTRGAEPPARMSVRGDWIVSRVGGYAQLRLLASQEGGRVHRGAALWYAEEERELWICPEEGWGLSPGAPAPLASVARWLANHPVTDLWLGERRAERADEVGAFCADVEIADDGRSVRYERRGLLGREHRTFDVAARASSRSGEPGLR